MGSDRHHLGWRRFDVGFFQCDAREDLDVGYRLGKANVGAKLMNIYISSSWKNRDRVRAMAVTLRTVYDAIVYDFTDPACRGVPEIPPEMFPEQFDPEKGTYQEYLRSFPHWAEAVKGNRKAIEACDMVLLMLPCGNDAHADAYYGLGLGKTLIIVGQPKAGDRTPTHLWAEAMLDEDNDVFALISECMRGRRRKCPPNKQCLACDRLGYHLES